ncbi:DedA family protein [Vibrio sp. S4M6]|uniref:DedA family protein n=1 Tax=Vibrio sinus TaxID=2946865 RepID=UPI002029BDCE|nr:DedA family protein [Vibrio sinus]MCL9780443.1 DedA family protein [Vibrio sinus]
MRPLLEHYGYLALIVSIFFEGTGIPLPGQSVLITASILASQGVMNFPLVIIVGWLSCFLGNTCGYFVGYHFESWLAKKGYISESKLKKMHEKIQKYGPTVLVISRFVEGLKQFMPLACGMAKMSKSAFFIGNAIASTLWVIVFSILVNYIFAHLDSVLHFYHHHKILLWGITGLIVLAIAYLVLRKRRK